MNNTIFCPLIDSLVYALKAAYVYPKFNLRDVFLVKKFYNKEK